MNEALKNLLNANRLEQLDDDLFVGRGSWGSTTRLYGGQVMSQSLSAAQQTVSQDMVLHSMHAYFMRPGNPQRQVIYDVEKIRDGKSFVSRRVTARQHGRAIYSCQCSFQIVEDGYSHQRDMPDVVGPEHLKSDAELARDFPPELNMPELWPIEFRQVEPLDLHPEPVDSRSYVWMKSDGALPDDLCIHQQMLAFATDNFLLPTSLRPHGIRAFMPEVQAATIDHSLWFHRPFRIDEWLLFDLYSPNASNAKGLNLGYIYDRSGILVATTMQEGLIRYRG